jgi:hypothetical protein
MVMDSIKVFPNPYTFKIIIPQGTVAIIKKEATFNLAKIIMIGLTIKIFTRSLNRSNHGRIKSCNKEMAITMKTLNGK